MNTSERAQVLEEAALACEKLRAEWAAWKNEPGVARPALSNLAAAHLCAEAIRALK
jgi:hypothetical protein